MKKLETLKTAIDSKIQSYGIIGYEITNLLYLEFDPTSFQNPKNVAKRIIILYSLFIASKNFLNKNRIKKWLKKENLWNHCTPKEMKFLSTIFSSRKERIPYSWSIESVIVLAWAINKINFLPQIIEEISIPNLNDLTTQLPDINSNTKNFIDSSYYRNSEEIFKENIVNEICTTYFRDLIFSNSPDKTNINRMISFERHKALNWIRKYGNIESWDEVDTST